MPSCESCGAPVGIEDSYCTACGSSVEVATDEYAAIDDDPTSAETWGRRISVVGAGITAVAAFLPWVTAEHIGSTAEMTGIQGDGVFTLLLALVVGIVVWVGRGKRWSVPSRVTVFVLGLAIASLAAYYISGPGAVTDAAEDSYFAIRVGNGLYLTLIGGGLTAVGALFPRRAGV